MRAHLAIGVHLEMLQSQFRLTHQFQIQNQRTCILNFFVLFSKNNYYTLQLH